MSRYYESRNARETLRCLVRIYILYVCICRYALLSFYHFSLSILLSFLSVAFLNYHLAQHYFVTTVNCRCSLIICSRVFHLSLILIYTFFLEIYFCIANSLRICKKVTIHYKFTFIRTYILINSNKE